MQLSHVLKLAILQLIRLLSTPQPPTNTFVHNYCLKVWYAVDLCVWCLSLQRILDLASLDGVLNQCHIKPQHIIHNMTKVNKHGVVTLEDKSSKFIQFVLVSAVPFTPPVNQSNLSFICL